VLISCLSIYSLVTFCSGPLASPFACAGAVVVAEVLAEVYIWPSGMLMFRSKFSEELCCALLFPLVPVGSC